MMRNTLKMNDTVLGSNVGMIFVFYFQILTTQFIMVCCWTLFVIIPWAMAPPAGFKWNLVTWNGLSGERDEYFEKSLFFFGAYEPVHTVFGSKYPMDVTYFATIIVMFFVQVSSTAYYCIW